MPVKRFVETGGITIFKHPEKEKDDPQKHDAVSIGRKPRGNRLGFQNKKCKGCENTVRI